MISNIKELQIDPFVNVEEIITMKSNSPVEGDIYLDPTTNKTWIFSCGRWSKLQLFTNSVSFRQLERKRKINSLFDE